MNVIQNLIADLREKRLWPVAVVLVVALIAVPVIISSGGNSSVPVAQLPPLPSSGGSTPALPAVSVTATPSHARLTGPQRNPFRQQGKQSSGSTGSSTSKSSSSSSSTSSKSSSSSSSAKGSSTSGAVSGSSTTVSSTPTTTTGPVTPTLPKKPAPPAPAGLTATEAYHVSISMSNSAGGLYTIDPLERLSLLPSVQEPRLIELGVLGGGRRVLFAVEPGALVRGPGRCTPGPIDCEIVSLAPNQIEWVGTSGPTGVTGLALMAVTGISAAHYPSRAAANRARAQESAAGRRLLSASKLSALSLFQYQPGRGSVINLSNVTVGGKS